MPEQTSPSIGAKAKPKNTINTKVELIHAETALLLAKMKSLVQKTDDDEDVEMYVYDKEGVKITL